MRCLTVASALVLLQNLACSTEPAPSAPDSEASGGTTRGSSAGGAPSSGGTAAPGSGGSGGSTTTSSGGEASGSGGASLTECDTPSIDRYQQWLASGEGPTIPATGSLLVAEGDGYKAQVEFTSDGEWHVTVLQLGNQYEAQADLSASSGLTITYSSTADFFVQVRPASAWNGGAKWHALLPASEGLITTLTIPFDEAEWFEKLGPPPHTLAEALAEVRGLMFVGNEKNEISITGLTVDGYVPTCL